MKRVLYFLLFLSLIGCDSKIDNKTIKIYQYQFEGFDKNEVAAQLLATMTKFYSANDFVITTNEELMAVERNSKINVDTLEKFHPYLHRIEIFDPEKKYKPGDVKIIVASLSGNDKWPKGFNFCRYTYSKYNKWEIQYDLGSHNMEGVPNEAEKKTSFIIIEIARASFK
jgi:hypothetical protein